MTVLAFILGLLAGAAAAWLAIWRLWLQRRQQPASQLLSAIMAERAQTRDAEEERDRLFNLSLDLLAISDLQGRPLQVNPAWVRVLHWSRDEIMAQPFPELCHPDDRPAALHSLAELSKGTPVRDVELRTRCRDGTYRWLAWNSFPLTARQTVFTVAHDITERKQTEQQLQRYQERLQRLASQLAMVEERQNRRLAEILHDTLAQELFAAQAKLSLLRYPERIDDPQAIIGEVLSILDQANALTRSLTFELFPPSLYEVGLDAALEWLCRSFKQTRGLVCRFKQEGELPDLGPDLRALLYQGARELLGNAYKHGNAAAADVSLLSTAQSISLRVDDDGCGFVLENAAAEDSFYAAAGGFGLFNLRERLGQLGGTLRIDRSPQAGGRVTITVPLHGESVA